MYTIVSIISVICVWFLIRKTISKHFNFRVSGKVGNVITIFSLVVVGVFCSLFYLKYDSKGFEYGLGCNFCSKNLPYNVIPQTDRYGSFTLNDYEGFELIGNGFGYKKSSFIIKDFLAYGYNDTSIVVKCTDSLNNVKHLYSYETGYKSDDGNPVIGFEDMAEIKYLQVKKKYTWTDVDEEEGNKIRFYRTLSFIGIIVSLLLILRVIFRLKKTQATQ